MIKKSQPILNEQGVIPVLVLIAVVGLLIFLAVSAFGNFNGGLFKDLYDRAQKSFASGPFASEPSSTPAPTPSAIPVYGLSASAYWALDDSSWNGSNGEVKDSAGFHNGMALKNGNAPLPKTVASNLGRAGDFAGVSYGNNGYLSFGNIYDLNATQSFTLAFWAKYPTQTSINNYPAVIGKIGSNGQGYLVSLDSSTGASSNQIGFHLTDTSGHQVIIGDSKRHDDNVWHYYVAVIDRSAKKVYFYVDGSLKGNASASTLGSLSNNGGFVIGSRQDSTGINSGFTGQVDEVYVYGRAFSAADAKPPVAAKRFSNNGISATLICPTSQSTPIQLTVTGTLTGVYNTYYPIWVTVESNGTRVLAESQSGSQPNVGLNYIDSVTSIRGETPLKLYGDGRQYTLNFYSTQDGSNTQNLTGLFNSIPMSISCGGAVSPTPTPAPTSTPFPSPTPTPFKRVFVTSGAYTGGLGGLSGADYTCQQRANSTNLGGTWKAWLSDEFTDASSRLTHSNYAYKLLNGTTIANNWAGLTSGGLLASISVNEYNNFSHPSKVWTYTDSHGSRIHSNSVVNDCEDWHSGSSALSGLVGNTSSTGSQWTYDNNSSTPQLCDSAFNPALYCFEQ